MLKARSKSKEPLRHSASPRNRRKALHQAECILEDLEFDLIDSAAIRVRLRYKHSKARKLVNRLKAEVRRDRNAE